MKIEYSEVKNFVDRKKSQSLSDSYLIRRHGKPVFRFFIAKSILKTHFKALMKVATLYDAISKIGFITTQNEDEFLSLVLKIEASDEKRCEKSHAKSIEKFKTRKHESQECRECPDCAEEIAFNGTHKCWESGLTY